MKTAIRRIFCILILSVCLSMPGGGVSSSGPAASRDDGGVTLLLQLPDRRSYDDKISFSRDGKLVAVKSKNAVGIWSAEGALLRRIEIPGVRSAVFAPDSTGLATVDGSSVKIWRFDGRIAMSLGLQSPDAPFVFSPEGSLFALRCNNREKDRSRYGLAVFGTDGALRGHIPIDSLRSFGFGPGGKVIGVTENRIHLWNAAGRSLDATRFVYRVIESAAVSPDGRLACAMRGGRIDLYRVQGSSLRRYAGIDHGNGYVRMSFCGNGLLNTFESGGGRIRQWDTDGRAVKTVVLDRIPTPENDYDNEDVSGPGDLAASPDGGFFLDRYLRLWNDRGRCVKDFAGGFRSSEKCIGISDDGELFAFARDRGDRVHVWHIEGYLVKELRHQGGQFGSFTFSRDNSLIAYSAESRIHVAELGSGRTVAEFTVEEDAVIHALRFGPDNGRLLAAVDRRNDGLHIWSLRERKFERILSLPGGVGTFAVSGDGLMVAAGAADNRDGDANFHLWNMNGARLYSGIIEDVHIGRLHNYTSEWDSYKHSIRKIAFGPDSKSVVFNLYSSIVTLRLADKKIRRVPLSRRYSLYFTQEGAIATQEEGDARIAYRDMGGVLVRTLNGAKEDLFRPDYTFHEFPLTSFSLRDSRFVHADHGGITVYDAASGAEVARLHVFDNGSGVMCTPDHYYRVTGDAGKIVRFVEGGHVCDNARCGRTYHRPDIVLERLHSGSGKDRVKNTPRLDY